MTQLPDQQQDHSEQASSEQYNFTQVLLPPYLANPYPLYRSLRESDPVHWNEMLESWIILRNKDVRSVLDDARFSTRLHTSETLYSSDLQERFPLAFRVLSLLVFLLDSPSHVPLRTIFSQSGILQNIRATCAHVQPLANQLLERGIKEGQLDIMRDFSYPLTIKIMEGISGIPLGNQDQVALWATALEPLIDAYPDSLPEFVEALHIITACLEHFQRHLPHRHLCDKDRSFSTFSGCKERGDEQEKHIALSHCLNIIAGLHTTACQVGNAFYTLIEHPNQFQQLCTNSVRLSLTISELLRYHNTVQMASRVATTDVELAGKHIKAHQRVLLSLGAANRDPEQFADPDALDFSRQDKHSLTFGYGAHICLGIPIVRFALECALKSLIHHAQLPSIISIQWRSDRVTYGPAAFLAAFERY